MAKGMRRMIETHSPPELLGERVAGEVHVEAARHAIADEPSFGEHPVPPTVHDVLGHALLRIATDNAVLFADAAVVLGVEQVVVRLRRPVDLVEGREEVLLKLEDDATPQRDHATLLALSVDGERPSRHVDVAYPDTRELRAPDAAVEQDEQGNAVAGPFHDV